MKVSFAVVIFNLLLWPSYGVVINRDGAPGYATFREANSISTLKTSHQPAQKRSRVGGKVRYACPMHPEVTGRQGGRCRKCGMALRPYKTETTAASIPTDPATSLGDPEKTVAVRNIPDVLVTDQNGRRFHFRSDLIAGKVVAINFIFTTCTTICPPLTATFRRVQQELETNGNDVQLISVSVDPSTDTPERLHDFAAKFKAGPGWTFVTGDKDDIDSILQALGVAVADKNDHTPMVLIGNDAVGYWTRTYGLASPLAITKQISIAKTAR
jgi:cytochrome oxidase Cu insertion factor (SCO1/SenC/PrrC family)